MALTLIPPNLKSYKYYAPASAGTVTGSDLVIAATAFVDDSGSAVTAFPTNYANYTMFINGIPQENGSATITTQTLRLSAAQCLIRAILLCSIW